MNPADVAAALDVGIAAVRDAGSIALEYFRTDMAIDNKLAGIAYDPVTAADERVEAYVRAAIEARFPDHQVIGEESGTTGSGPISWIIDPIDGTRAFISGMPTWATLLGLVVDDQPVAGVMHQPFTDETFTADPVRGSRFLHAGTERRLSARATATILDDAIMYSTHPSMLEWAGVLDRYQALSSRVRLQRWGGDCYAFALVAMGTIDLVIDGCLMPYDIVPLIPIIELAGGVVTDLEGRVPMGGGTVIAAANPELHAHALAALRG
jgi:histidinol phosphatase-like enzyme (inositol monophosphatase family)